MLGICGDEEEQPANRSAVGKENVNHSLGNRDVKQGYQGQTHTEQDYGKANEEHEYMVEAHHMVKFCKV